MPDQTVNTAQLFKAIHTALRSWNNPVIPKADPLAALQITQRKVSRLTQWPDRVVTHQAVQQVILDGLAELRRKEQENAELLNLRFIERKTILQVAHRLHLSPDQINRRQRTAITQLTEILLAREEALREQRSAHIFSRLPPQTCTHLLGRYQSLETLHHQLLQAAPPWVLALVGMGGIGKTALAHTLVRQLVPLFHFHDIAWLYEAQQGCVNPGSNTETSPQALIDRLIARAMPNPMAESGQFNALRLALKGRPHLIVVDGLAGKADHEAVFSQLLELAEPSKFLVTCRHWPPAHLPVFSLPLGELSRDDAALLLQQHAKSTGKDDLAEVLAEHAHQVYQVVGGNPAALKLVTALSGTFSPLRVLKSLRYGHEGKVERLYRHIYQRDWLSLGSAARELLQAMASLSVAPIQPEKLQAINGVESSQIDAAIQELVSRSLLEVCGPVASPAYHLPQLTKTFLNTKLAEQLMQPTL